RAHAPLELNHKLLNVVWNHKLSGAGCEIEQSIALQEIEVEPVAVGDVLLADWSEMSSRASALQSHGRPDRFLPRELVNSRPFLKSERARSRRQWFLCLGSRALRCARRQLRHGRFPLPSRRVGGTRSRCTSRSPRWFRGRGRNAWWSRPTCGRGVVAPVRIRPVAASKSSRPRHAGTGGR